MNVSKNEAHTLTRGCEQNYTFFFPYHPTLFPIGKTIISIKNGVRVEASYSHIFDLINLV